MQLMFGCTWSLLVCCVVLKKMERTEEGINKKIKNKKENKTNLID